MKNKKRGIRIACAIVVTIAVITAVLTHVIFDKVSVHNYLQQDLENIYNIVLVSQCPEIDKRVQSIVGVKEAVRLGANAVTVDLCFRSDGTPVITDKYEKNADADTVEELFKELISEKYLDIKIYFNIVQLSSLSQLNQLAVRYNMINRIYLIGIDESHYGLVTSDDTIIPFLLKYSFTKEELQSIEDGRFTAPVCITQYGASGLEIDAKYATNEIMTALNDFGIPFIVSGINSTSGFCEALLNGASTVIVNDIQTAREIFDSWIDIMRERYKSSLEQLQDITK